MGESHRKSQKRDLGIFVTDDLKPSVQCANKGAVVKMGGSAPGSHLSPLQKYEPTWLNLSVILRRNNAKLVALEWVWGLLQPGFVK